MTTQTIAIDHLNTYYRDFSSFMENEKLPYSMKFILLLLYKRYFLSFQCNCDFLISGCNFDTMSNKLIWNRFHPYLKYIVSYKYDSKLPNHENCRTFLSLFSIIDQFQIQIKATAEQIQQIRHHVFLCKSFQNITSHDLTFQLVENNNSLDYCKISILDENKTQFVIGKTSQKQTNSSFKIDNSEPNETIRKMYSEIEIKTYKSCDNIKGSIGCFTTNSVVGRLEEYYYTETESNTVYGHTVNGNSVALKGMKNNVKSLCCHDNWIVAGGFGELHIWNQHIPYNTFFNSSFHGFKTNIITNVKMNQDKLIATSFSSKSSTLLLFDLERNFSLQSNLVFYDLNISSLHQESSNRTWIGTNKGSIFMIDNRNENTSFALKTETESPVNCIDCTQANKNNYIVSGQDNGKLCIWDIRNVSGPIWIEEHYFKSITSIRFADIGNVIAYTATGTRSCDFTIQSMHNFFKKEECLFSKRETHVVCHDIYSKEEKIIALCTFHNN